MTIDGQKALAINEFLYGMSLGMGVQLAFERATSGGGDVALVIPNNVSIDVEVQV